MEWISVKDELPKLNDVVIVYHKAYLDGNSAVVYNKPDGSGFVLFYTESADIYLEPSEDFTHWMPLPNPPKS